MTTAHDRPDVLAFLMNGDLAALDDEQRLWCYLHECERMGLDPAARPLEFMTLSGRVVLYAKRIAGDMLAAKHRVSIVLVAGPDVRDFGGAKLFFAHARATLPDGRSVEDVASLPFGDPANAVMKVTTKAFRRATLRLCGWGGLDEDELESIPAAPSNDLRHVPAPGERAPEVLQRVRDDLAQFLDPDHRWVTLEQAAAVYAEHLPELGDAAHDAAAMCRDACRGDGTKRPSMAAFRRAVDVASKRAHPGAVPAAELAALFVTPDPDAAATPAARDAPNPVALLIRAYDAARTFADVHEADTTGIKLAPLRDSDEYNRIRAARQNACTRIRASAPGVASGLVPAAASVSRVDYDPDPEEVQALEEAAERAAIEAEPDAVTVERDAPEPWERDADDPAARPAHQFATYLATKDHPEAVANAFAARWREFGVEEAYARRLAIARWIGTQKDPSKVSEMMGANALRGAEARAAARAALGSK